MSAPAPELGLRKRRRSQVASLDGLFFQPEVARAVAPMIEAKVCLECFDQSVRCSHDGRAGENPDQKDRTEDKRSPHSARLAHDGFPVHASIGYGISGGP